MNRRFALVLFSTNPRVIARAEAGGVDAVVVDWERIGKESRQAGADTQINHDTLDDLRRVRKSTSLPVICRINRVGETTEREVEDAVTSGADEILVPMVRGMGEVELVFRIADSRCGVGILVETADAVEASAQLGLLPLSRAYVGLNDLAIDRGDSNIFHAVADGTVERVRGHFRRVPFGFGGLTVPERGFPVPCRLLLGEMSRLECDFSFLRRSFHRDVGGADPADAVLSIRKELESAAARTPARIASDLLELRATILQTHCSPAEISCG